ncbi:unnamed protein product [Blepharisma stoltei]|uniref:Uncharacterized protein n=1 Tax=Blepharisma stoltei TaxID=1481888 RepID=A0AAU9J3J3_9CILI|nr:unnamed protein product [Blepharisma stoltei]
MWRGLSCVTSFKKNMSKFQFFPIWLKTPIRSFSWYSFWRSDVFNVLIRCRVRFSGKFCWSVQVSLMYLRSSGSIFFVIASISGEYMLLFEEMILITLFANFTAPFNLNFSSPAKESATLWTSDIDSFMLEVTLSSSVVAGSISWLSGSFDFEICSTWNCSLAECSIR